MTSKSNIILLGDSTIDNIVWVHEKEKTVSGCLKKDLEKLSTQKPEEIVKNIEEELFNYIINKIKN